MPVRTHLQEVSVYQKFHFAHVFNALQYPPPEITLLVVGPHGCGKSTVIQKGLKHYGLSKPEDIVVPGGKGTFTCA